MPQMSAYIGARWGGVVFMEVYHHSMVPNRFGYVVVVVARGERLLTNVLSYVVRRCEGRVGCGAK